MKKLLLFAFILFLGNQAFAQTGIGTTTPDPSAQLDVTSTSRGFLPPRMTQYQRNAISSPAAGLIIYQTDSGAGFFTYNGSDWVRLAEPPVVKTFHGQATTIAAAPAGGPQWVFTGSPVNVTVSTGQTISLTGVAVMGVNSTQAEIGIGMCYQPVGGGEIKPVFGGFTEILIPGSTRLMLPVVGSISSLVAGTYKIGIGIRNTSSGTVGNNDYMNMVVQTSY